MVSYQAHVLIRTLAKLSLEPFLSFVPTKHFMIFLVIQQFPNLRRHVLYVNYILCYYLQNDKTSMPT
ncbi:MAG: hypothetical protein ACJ71O_05285, partial [Nitrososphaeraceae archaeon]